VSLLFWIVFLVGDRGYDADWFREALQGKDIKPCIPGRISRRKTVNMVSKNVNAAIIIFWL